MLVDLCFKVNRRRLNPPVLKIAAKSAKGREKNKKDKIITCYLKFEYCIIGSKIRNG